MRPRSCGKRFARCEQQLAAEGSYVDTVRAASDRRHERKRHDYWIVRDGDISTGDGNDVVYESGGSDTIDGGTGTNSFIGRLVSTSYTPLYQNSSGQAVSNNGTSWKFADRHGDIAMLSNIESVQFTNETLSSSASNPSVVHAGTGTFTNHLTSSAFRTSKLALADQEVLKTGLKPADFKNQTTKPVAHAPFVDVKAANTIAFLQSIQTGFHSFSINWSTSRFGDREAFVDFRLRRPSRECVSSVLLDAAGCGLRRTRQAVFVERGRSGVGDGCDCPVLVRAFGPAASQCSFLVSSRASQRCSFERPASIGVSARALKRAIDYAFVGRREAESRARSRA